MIYTRIHSINLKLYIFNLLHEGSPFVDRNCEKENKKEKYLIF